MKIGAVLLALEGQREGRALVAEGLGVTGLLTVANRPLLQQATEALAGAGVSDVVVASSGPVAHAVRRAVGEGGARHRVHHVELPAGADAVDAIRAARRVLDDGPLVVQGDDSLVIGGLDQALTSFHEHGLDALQLALPAAQRPSHRDAGGAIELRQRPRLAGVQILGDRAIAALTTEAGPGGGIDELSAAVRDAGGRVELDDRVRAWRFSGEVESFLEVNRLVLDRLAAEAPAGTAEVPGARTEGKVLVDPTADVRGSRLRGPLLIGPGACVRDSYVGPYTCVAAGARLEGAEIEYSVVLADARITHVGVRIEDSVIGAGARVHRTFTMPTALRMHVGPGAQVSLS